MSNVETMRAGALRDRVTFYIRPAETDQDTTGHVQQQNAATDFSTWTVRAADVPARLDPIRGQEPFEGNLSNMPNRDISEEYVLLSMRYDADTLPAHTDAVVCDERVYDIQSIKLMTNRKRRVTVVLREVI